MPRRLLLALLLCTLGAPAVAHADRDYTMRFGAVDRGDVAIVANTIMSCPTTDQRCAGARDGTGDTIRNSAFTMTHVDVDADATTFNSSSADLSLPAGATVLFAGLYWGSDTAAGDGGVAAPDPLAKGTVLLASGSTWAYQAVSATQLDTSRSFGGTRYQGFADVTERVRAAGSGTYTVAHVQAATGSDNFGGWGLVVAYRDEVAPVRWLGVYDGFHQLTDNNVRNTTLGGFRTPAKGTVDAAFGMMTYEGDLAVTGDYLRIGGRDVTDALHPVGNFFNSLITAHGEPVHAKNPDYLNQMGHEASLIDIDGFLGNDATSAAVQLGVGIDYLQTGPMTLAAEHAVDAPAASTPPTVTGEAREGSTLTASPGTWSGSPTYDYQWRRCTPACADVPDATGAEFTLGPADVGATMRVRVTATNRDGSASTESAPTATVVERAPVNTAPPVVTGTPREGEALTASSGSWTGSPELAYRWQRCTTTCADIAGAIGTTHELTAADVGATVRVQVTATNSGGEASAVSAATKPVGAMPPVNSAPPTVDGTALDGETLTASPGAWSGSPSFAYRWQRCDPACSDLAGATFATYVLGPADVGSTLRVRVTATNAGGSVSADSAPTTAVDARPPVNGEAPTVTGTAREGETLTASPGAWTGTPNFTYSYRWRRCGLTCNDIVGAVGVTYVLGAGDVGTTLYVRVTATNAGGSASAHSAPTTPVVAALRAPVSTAAPSITGNAREGETLTAHPGAWTGATTQTYQWRRCGSSCDDVPGAAGPTYDLGAADVGFAIRVRVTASNSAGATTADSAPTGTVEAASVHVPTPPPAATPTPGPGEPPVSEPPACGALSAVYTRGRTGTMRLRLELGPSATAVDFGVPAAMRPTRSASRRRSVGRLRVTVAGGAVRQQVLRFNRHSRRGLTAGRRSPRVRLTRDGVRVERIGRRVRRIELTLVTPKPTPGRPGVTVVARSRTVAGTLQRDACALITRG